VGGQVGQARHAGAQEEPYAQMTVRTDRRFFLAGGAAACLPWFGSTAVRAAEPFSFERLSERAAALARTPYQPRPAPPASVAAIDFNEHWRIRYRRERALFAGSAYPVSFFALNKYAATPVRIFQVRNGSATPFAYSPGLFEMPADSLGRKLPEDAGFAGFRVHRGTAATDWAAFLGASYFRAVGASGQYGLSARGVAVDTGVAGPEEFPDFVEFYLEPAEDPGAPLGLYALLDGPSVTGAYAFELAWDAGTLMDVEARLFLRRDIERLGIAPITSMYWYSERDRLRGLDWRPEVHDSDGLALWTGAGERIWRPLNNPDGAVLSSFLDRDPRGYALEQRDRDIANYLDGVNYQLRPSLWVEPLEPWGEGSVQLFEFHTDLEVVDNIAAFWNPAAPALQGAEMTFRYRLHWTEDEAFPADIGRVVSTRAGSGGDAGDPPTPGVVKYVVTFAGGRLSGLASAAPVEPRVAVSAGRLEKVTAGLLVGTGQWLLYLDYRPPPDEPAELRAFLEFDGEPLTETWMFQHRPEAF